MRRMMAALAAVLLLALASLATAGTPKPEEVLLQALKFLSLGQYGREYDLLHPGQKKLIKRDAFVDCYTKNAPTFDIVSVKKIDQYRDPIKVLGVPQRTSQAVTLRLTLKSSTGGQESFNQTWHAVWTGKRWSWVLASADVRAFMRGTCPS